MTDYSIQSYGGMIADPVRMGLFAQALEAAVEPSSVVLDIGAGTGIFSLLACKYGAERVFAIEPSPAIEVARQLAEANGFGDRIVFFRDLSTKVELPQRATVLISDLRGVLPWYEQHIPSIVDARERLLEPDRVMIPGRDTVYAAVVEKPDQYWNLIAGYQPNPYGLDMGIAERIATNRLLGSRPSVSQLLVSPQQIAVLDYRQIIDPDLRVQLTFEVARDGAAYGLAVWFDRDLAPGIFESHAPGAHPAEQPSMLHGNMFLSFSRPVAVRQGDSISATLSAELGASDYTWSWATRIDRRNGADVDTVEFVQSSLLGEYPKPAGDMAKADDEYLPSLNEEGRILHATLSAMDGDTENEIIASRLRESFAETFATEEAALERVAEIARRFSD